jgi:DNA modification methylase
MVYRSSKETKLKFYDTYIWHKKNGIPNGSNKRFRNNTEFIFHFCKDAKQMKFYMDRVLIEPKDSYKNRFNNEVVYDGQGQIVEGARIKNKTIKFLTGQKNKTKEGYKLPQTIRTLPDKVRPDNVVRFATAGASRDNTIKHPAPFNKELPLYYINLLTDKNDIVLDIFSGIGTTGIACKELDRNYIGFELNELYCDFSKKRLLEYDTKI